MDISALEQKLHAARIRFEKAVAAMAPKHKGGEWEEYHAVHAELLSAERELAAAKGEEYAVPLDFPVQWDIGAPLPHLITTDYRTFLTFYVNIVDPNWDGTYVTIRDPKASVAEPIALVEFFHCVSAKLGAPNDEVFHGHPLYGRGLEAYGAQIVRNSKWIAELENINKVHHLYNADRWRTLNHYVFGFHDDTFECVAESYKVEVYQETMAAILNRICERLLE
jgi:hypothetical protein